MEQYFEDEYLTPSWMPIECEHDVEYTNYEVINEV
jgi:hypothetical protein